MSSEDEAFAEMRPGAPRYRRHSALRPPAVAWMMAYAGTLLYSRPRRDRLQCRLHHVADFSLRWECQENGMSSLSRLTLGLREAALKGGAGLQLCSADVSTAGEGFRVAPAG